MNLGLMPVKGKKSIIFQGSGGGPTIFSWGGGGVQ